MKGILTLIALALLVAAPATGGKVMEEAEIQKAHRYFAVELNNTTWGLMDRAAELGPEELDRLIDRAHASLFHWSVVGERVNIARGQHLVSHAYATAKRGDEALHHASRCLAICEEEGYGDWDLAFALEAMALAHAVIGDEKQRDAFLARAKEAGEAIAGKEDKEIFFSELKKVPGYQD